MGAAGQIRMSSPSLDKYDDSANHQKESFVTSALAIQSPPHNLHGSAINWKQEYEQLGYVLEDFSANVSLGKDNGYDEN